MVASVLAFVAQAGHAAVAGADDLVSWLQTLLYVNVVQPMLFHIDMMDVDEDTYDALYWVIVGLLEVGLMYALLRPLEALAPVEKWRDRKGVGVDALYTWITRLDTSTWWPSTSERKLCAALPTWIVLTIFWLRQSTTAT